MRRTPRQLRSRLTVETILEAAAQVFEREGLEATTNRIAERAGYSIGTLYQYFPDKHALMSAHAPRVPDGVARLEALRAALATELAGHLVRCGRGGPGFSRTAALLVHTADAQLHGVLLGAEDAETEPGRSLLALL